MLKKNFVNSVTQSIIFYPMAPGLFSNGTLSEFQRARKQDPSAFRQLSFLEFSRVLGNEHCATIIPWLVQECDWKLQLGAYRTAENHWAFALTPYSLTTGSYQGYQRWKIFGGIVGALLSSGGVIDEKSLSTRLVGWDRDIQVRYAVSFYAHLQWPPRGFLRLPAHLAPDDGVVKLKFRHFPDEFCAIIWMILRVLRRAGPRAFKPWTQVQHVLFHHVYKVYKREHFIS